LTAVRDGSGISDSRLPDDGGFAYLDTVWGVWHGTFAGAETVERELKTPRAVPGS
jgi:hypothetical protein